MLKNKALAKQRQDTNARVHEKVGNFSLHTCAAQLIGPVFAIPELFLKNWPLALGSVKKEALIFSRGSNLGAVFWS